MSEAWQQAWVEVLPDFKDFKRTADKQMSGILGGAGTAGGLAAGKNLQPGILGGIKGLAVGVVGAVAALGIGRLIGDAVGAGIRYGMEGLNLASELEQNTGAVLAVFKDQAAVIEGFGKNAAKDVGLARSEYLKFATVVGAQLKNMGIPMGEVAGQTGNLITLGADLAAQFGGPTSDAVSALSSLLRGERDPIERYGVGIKQADINARLAAEGLSKLEGEAKKQAEIQATLAILWEQTADAQGTFAREGDTLAGQQQRLQATLQDTQTKLGESLLPSFTVLAGFANETLAPALGRVIDKVGPALGEALERATPKIEALLTKLEPMVDEFARAAAEEGIPAFIGAMDEIAEHAPEWIDAFQQADQAVWDLDKAFRDSQDALQSGREERIKWFDEVLEGFGNFVEDAINSTSGMSEHLKEDGKEAVGGLVDGISLGAKARRDGLAAEMRAAGEFAGQGLIDGMKFKTPEAAAAAAGMGRRAVEAFRQEMKIQSPSKVMAELGAYMGEGLALGMEGKTARVQSAVGSLVSVPSISMGIASSVGPASAGGARDGRLAETLIIYESVSPTATAMEVARRQNAFGNV